MSVKAALLQLLNEGDAHGYHLKSEFESRTGGIWPLNVGQVYTTLDRLVRDDLVVELDDADAAAGHGQRTYRLTDAGRFELQRWLTSAPSDKAPPRDEMITKVLVAMGRSTSNELGTEDATSALAVLDAQRSALFTELATQRQHQRHRTDRAELLAHDALMGRIEADLEWLDRCEARLNAHDRNSGSTP